MNEVKSIEPAFRDELAEATDVQSAKAVRDRAVAIEAYAKEARDPELINHAVEVRLKAERKAGDLLRGMAERGERAKGGEAGRRELQPVTLDDLGVTKAQSSRWQNLAALDEGAFLTILNEAQHAAASAIELTPQERKRDKQERRAERESSFAARIEALPDERFGVILADPAWRFEPYSRETGMDRSADNHYPTSELETIKARDVPSRSDPFQGAR
jgi:hypothetical protein